MYERTSDGLPKSDMERVVLCDLLRWPERSFPSVRSCLKPSDFMIPGYALLLQAMYEQWDKTQNLDEPLLDERLKSDPVYLEMGGADVLFKIWEATPSPACVEEHAKVVAENAARRRAREVLEQGIQVLNDGQTTSEDIAGQTAAKLQACSLASDGGRGVGPDEALKKLAQQTVKEAGHARIPLPIIGVESYIRGLRRGWHIVLGGLCGSGKTSYALQVVSAALKVGVGVRIHSLEMSAGEVYGRLLAQETECHVEPDPHDGCLRVETAKLEQFKQNNAALRELPIIVDDTHNITMDEIAARAAQQQSLGRLGLVVIDYLQIVQAPEAENRTRELELMSRACKVMAGNLNVTVLLVCQLSRDATRADRPSMAHLRGSSSIEQDADVVLITHGDQGDKGRGHIFIDKNRYGPIGSVDADWYGAWTKFKDCAGGGFRQ